MKNLRTLLGAAISTFALAATAAPDEPAWPTREWPVSSPEAQGMDSAALAKLVDFGAAGEMDSLLVTRHGRIVLEATYAPFKPGMKHTLNSATKSVVGTLVAMAVDKGLLEGTQQRVVDLFADRKIEQLDDRKKAVTIQSLLDMTSGIDWTEPLGGAPETILEMTRSREWQQFVLDRPMAETPGRSFNYNSGNTHLLSAILSRKTGRSTQAFAEQELFKPLGISDIAWRRDPQGVSLGGWGLYLQPRDMAKIGYLYLRGGMWEGQRLVPPAWIEEVMQARIDMRLGGGSSVLYANSWWVVPARHAYMAVGFKGQVIAVLPELDIVAVTTGRKGEGLGAFLAQLADAVKANGPLPANPGAEALIAQRISEAATEKLSAVPPAPALATSVSGKTYRFGRNPLGVESFRLDLAGPQPAYDMVVATPRLPTPTQRWTGPIGMDGRFAVNVQGGGVNAVKGTWVAADTLAVVWRYVLDGSASSYTLKFDGNHVAVTVEDAFGNKFDLQGMASD